jgi:arylsulfatase A-like enzyme
MSKKPNVIIITTDQQRYDSVGINGSSFMRTPNMDRIGKEGVSFERAYCPNTVCTPARVSIMTGLHISRHGAYNIGTSAMNYSNFLSTILSNHGYCTHHIGKAHWHPWGASSAETALVDEAGTPFKDFAGFDAAELSVGHNLWGVQSHYAHWLKEKGYFSKDFKFHKIFEKDANDTGIWDMPVAMHPGTWLAERAVAFLKNHDRSKPFYLNLGFQDPHHPHALPLDYKNTVDPASVPLPDIFYENEEGTVEHIEHFRKGTLLDSRFNGKYEMAGQGRCAWGEYFKNEERMELTRAYYYSMVQLIDDQLGIILEALDELNYSEDTLVIFTTDHGEMLGDHCIGQKGPLAYEGVTHIPFLMLYPEGFKPHKVSECVSLVDIVPTILDFAEIDNPFRLDGISLRDRLQTGKPFKRKGVRIEYKEEPDKIRYKCWVTPEWKLVIYLGEEFGELYNLENDPGEKNNLYNRSEYSGVKNKLLVELLNDMELSEPLSERLSRV